MKSNYFDRLAARTLGTAPVSPPIVPPLFSPARQHEMPPHAPQFSSEGFSSRAAEDPQSRSKHRYISTLPGPTFSSSPPPIEDAKFTLPQPEPPSLPASSRPLQAPVTYVQEREDHQSSRAEVVPAEIVVRPDSNKRIQMPMLQVSQQPAHTPVDASPVSAAPIIRVTIGRVDVRAQFPAAPPAPTSRSQRPLALSLEDYSKQRAGGKR